MLGPDGLSGGLTIETRPDPELGYQWSLLVGPKRSAPGEKRMPVSGMCPGPNGGPPEPVELDNASGAEFQFGYNGYDPGGMHPENTHSQDLKTFKGLGEATGEFGNQHWEWDLTAAGGLNAVPKVSAVKRGAQATLNGSQSTEAARITEYLWRFDEVADACPDGAAPAASASKTGREVKIVALCDLKVTLTVSDGAGDSDTASTVLRVRARKDDRWRTPFRHREKAGDRDTPTRPPSVTALGGGDLAFSFFGGLNVSDCGEPTAGAVILCPKLDGGHSWLDKGYALQRVNDPGGPFDDQFYVIEPKLRVERAALINPSILPGSDFYRRNGQAAKGFLKAIRQHEGLGNGQDRSGHSGIIKQLLKRDPTNPRRAIEAVFGPGKSAVAGRADKRLRQVDGVLDKESDDPLVKIWTGTLDVFDSYRDRWVRVPGIEVPGSSARGRG